MTETDNFLFEKNKDVEYSCSYGKDTLEQVQKILFNLALTIKEIFDKNGIRYFLIYGTLLGAVRHGGFIPWDDDFDICVVYEDYDEAVDLLRKLLPDKYIVHDNQNDPVYWCQFSKIRYRDSETECLLWPEDNRFRYKGICLDVYRGWVEKSSKYSYDYRKSKLGVWSHVKCFKEKHNIRSIVAICYYSFRLLLFYILDSVAQKKGMFYRDPVQLVKPVPIENVFPLKTIKFNGIDFGSPNDPDSILRKQYGRYMEFPPVEKRIPHYSKVIIFE